MPANHDNETRSSNSRACNVCHGEFPRAAEFWPKQKRHRDGLGGTCKVCEARRVREWNAANLERGRAQRKAYRERNRESVLAGKIRYRLANLERTKAGIQAWKGAHREQISEWGKQYRIDNPERLAAKNRAWYLANPDLCKQRAREWVKANPERVRVRTARRRAAERNAPGQFTEDDLIKQFEAQRGMCFYCHEDLDGRGTIDHYIPLSKGGTNFPSNIVLACWPCNNAKRAKLPSEFRPRA